MATKKSAGSGKGGRPRQVLANELAPRDVLQFYRVIDGERRDQPATQNSFSSVCFYHCGSIADATMRSGHRSARTSVMEVRAYALGAGVNVIKETTWEVELPDGTSIGCYLKDED